MNKDLFEDDEIEGTGTEADVKRRLYINLSTTGNIVQTGEGQRTETNPKIKKMFLQNNYFRYTGDEASAEIITELREEVANELDNYGLIDEKNTVFDGLFLETTEKIITKGRGTTGKMLKKYILKDMFLPYYQKWLIEREKILKDLGYDFKYIYDI